MQLHHDDFNELRYSYHSFEHKTSILEQRMLENIHKNIFNNNDIMYILPMFPYPSGKLHLGHIRNYTGTDLLARANVLMKKNVYCSIGYDAFGLPAENAAKTRGIQANKWTYDNIEEMQKELAKFNFYNFGRVTNELLITCDEKYYAHQQNFMKYLYKRGLLYRKESIVNWDPIEMTVLANEQVINGRGWRSEAIVEKKSLMQWFLKTSTYTNELLKNLSTLKWPKSILTMQNNWIGESNGYHIEFIDENNNKLIVFTTSPELIYGCTLLMIGPNSKIKSKTAYNKYNNKHIPIVISEFVHDDYATGIVMGVPFTHEKDRIIANQYNCEIIEILNNDKLINSFDLNGLTQEQARAKISTTLQPATYYSLRDWCISRQRAWGCILPFIHCKKCGIIPTNESIVRPPKNIDYTASGNVLNNYLEWKHVICYICGNPAQRETDTMDTFVDSSWYFTRYMCQDNTNNMCDDRTWKALPVDIYIGGAEHAILHLIYARFFMYLICDYYNKPHMEPFTVLMNQGMITAPTLKGERSGSYYHISEIDEKTNTAKICIDEKFIGENIIHGPCVKVSKSYKNSDSLSNLIELYGTDALRMFTISDTPYEQDFVYDIRNIIGCVNLLNRIWVLVYKFITNKKNEQTYNKNFNIKFDEIRFQMYDAFCKNKFNVMISTLHRICNLIHDNCISREQYLHAIIFILQWLWCISPGLATQCYELLKQYKYVDKNGIYEEYLNLNFDNVDTLNIFKVYANNKTIGEIECINLNETEIKNLVIHQFTNIDYKSIFINIKAKIIKFIN